MKLVTVTEAAKILGVHRSRVHALIQSERLPAQRVGAVYVIKERDLALVTERKIGRPKRSLAAQKV
jgi:excisionase family DNA binding protein